MKKILVSVLFACLLLQSSCMAPNGQVVIGNDGGDCRVWGSLGWLFFPFLWFDGGGAGMGGGPGGGGPGGGPR